MQNIEWIQIPNSVNIKPCTGNEQQNNSTGILQARHHNTDSSKSGASATCPWQVRFDPERQETRIHRTVDGFPTSGSS